MRLSGSARHWLKLAALVVLPAGLLVLAAEFIAGMTIARSARTTSDELTGRSTYSMRIGKWPWSRVTRTPLNSRGFPDDEFQPRAPGEGCVLVLFAGDSYLFGDGVDRDSSFFSILRRRAAAAPRCVRMHNTGERGTTIDRQARVVRDLLPLLQPDVVILVQYQNDLTDLTNPGAILDPNAGRTRPGARRDSIRVGSGIFNPDIVRMLSYHLFAWMIRNQVHRDLLRHWSVLADSSRAAEAARLTGTYSRLFGDLATELAGHRVPFGVVVIPSKFDILAGRFPEEAFFAALADDHALPWLSLFPLLMERRSPYAFLIYDGHLNELGNRIVAGALYNWLFATEPAPFPVLR
jgi:hypothetical protein